MWLQRLREEDCLITFALRVEPKSGRGWYLLAISYYTKVQKYAYQAPEFYTKHRLDQHIDSGQEKNQPWSQKTSSNTSKAVN